MTEENYSYGTQTLDRSPRWQPVTINQPPLSRASSLPLGIDGAVETPLAYLPSPSTFKPLNPAGRCSPNMHSSTSAQKRAQRWRTSMAVTNSDYYSQWKPQISTLAMLHGSTVIRNIPRAASLDAISESDSQNATALANATDDEEESEEDGELEMEDSGVFRYTPSRVMEDLVSTHTGSLVHQDMGHSSSSNTAQQTGTVSSNGHPAHENAREISGNSGEISGQPPIHNRRSAPPDASASPADYFNGIVALMILLLVCLDLPAIMCLLPALACSLQVKKRNEYGRVLKAKRWAEWSRCCCITAVLFHVVFLLIILLAIFLIHFTTNLF